MFLRVPDYIVGFILHKQFCWIEPLCCLGATRDDGDHMARPNPKSSDLLVRLGSRVRRLRKQREWTQIEMAEKFGVDRSFLAELERGRTNVSLLTLDTIARGFETSLSKLLSGL